MTWLTAHRLQKTAFLLALTAIWGSAVSQLMAGDEIVFGSAKTKAEPGKEKSLPNSFKLDKLTSPNPFDLDGVSPQILPRINVNPRKEKRQQNADDERKNWLLFERELQSKEDDKNFLGIREEELEDLENRNSHDYTFRENNSSRLPAQLRAPGQSQSRLPSQHRKSDANQPPPPREDAGDEPRRTPRTAEIVFGSRENQIGAGSGKELDLKGPLEIKGRERNGDRSDFSLGSVLNSPEAPRNPEQQRSRTESFRTLLAPPEPVVRGGFASQPFNPMMPTFGDSLRKSPDVFSPRQSGQPNSLNFLTSPDSGRGSGLGAPAPSSGTWKPTPVEWPKPRF